MMDKPTMATDRADIEAVLAPARRMTGVFTRRNLIWAGIAAVVVVGVYILFFTGASTKTTYVTEPVARGDLTAIVTATGTVQPTNQVDVSSELSGTVRKVMVDFNSEVKVGGVLAELDTDKLSAAVASSLQAPILFTIAEDLKKMEVQVDVDEADVGAVAQGQKAAFSVDAYADRKLAWQNLLA